MTTDPSRPWGAEVQKTQAIRLVDVLVLGPAMLWAGRELARCDREKLGAFIGIAGAATILYNWRNYERQRERDREDT